MEAPQIVWYRLKLLNQMYGLLRTGHTLWGMGWNNAGQLGDGSTSFPEITALGHTHFPLSENRWFTLGYGAKWFRSIG